MKRFLFFIVLTSAATLHAGVFDIQLSHTGTPTAAESAAFSNAEAMWESLITGYQDTVSFPALQIEVNLDPIDGSGGTLGSAGPTLIGAAGELNFAYATQGVMTFDTADTADMLASGSLEMVILHEMGHVIGIGTLWNIPAITSGDPWAGMQNLYTTGSYEYTGANALAAWQGEFGQTDATFVPVEDEGGEGTAEGHWNEGYEGGLTGITSTRPGDNYGRDFAFELMTGWANADSYISQVTLGGLVDIGYVVPSFDYNQPTPNQPTPNQPTPAVPEPSTLSLSLLAAGVMGFTARRRRKNASTPTEESVISDE